MQDKKSIPRFSSFKPPPRSLIYQVIAAAKHLSKTIVTLIGQNTVEMNAGLARLDAPIAMTELDPWIDLHVQKGGAIVLHVIVADLENGNNRATTVNHGAPKEKLRGDEAHALRALSEARNQPPNDEHDLFIIDRRGDRHNITYGATHRYAVPNFRRAGSGRVIGINTRYSIDREHRETDTLVLRTREQGFADGARSKSTRLMSKGFTQPTQLFRLKAEGISGAAFEHMQDFIQFDSTTQHNPYDDNDSADDRHAYRSIYGKAKDEDVVPGELESLPDSITLEQDIQVDIDADRKARNAELSRAIESHPMDVAAWLRLIDHQDTLILGATDESRSFTYAERQSLAEVKLSLYEKALKKVGESPHRDRLLLGRLYEGAKLWNRENLLAEWKGVLKKNPAFIGLWVKYIDFRQTDFQDFAFEQCNSIFIDCLRLNASSAASPYKTQVQCYLFLRLTLFLRESGYIELSVGLWQAVLEFTCFRPSSFAEDNDKEGALSSFANFWESEVARIGELGAAGWRNAASSDVDPSTHVYELEVDSTDILTSWANAERERLLDSQMPARSIDDFKSGMDDAYTVVLFSDLQNILPLFWEVNNLDDLIDSFLYFCHLPHLTVPQNAPTTRLWSGDNFVRNEILDNAQNDLSPWMSTQGG
ncbi:hypothetical protein N7526_007404 [Penicillium atrosanguineum]|nr:hypothetical protein N7526_007404 [Penicillium atrosanguineum]